MYSIAFPNIFQNKLKTNLFKDKDATASNLWLLLNSDKLTLFGDPYFGTGLKKAIFEQGDVVLVDILIDEIFVHTNISVIKLSVIIIKFLNIFKNPPFDNQNRRLTTIG